MRVWGEEMMNLISRLTLMLHSEYFINLRTLGLINNNTTNKNATDQLDVLLNSLKHLNHVYSLAHQMSFLLHISSLVRLPITLTYCKA